MKTFLAYFALSVAAGCWALYPGQSTAPSEEIELASLVAPKGPAGKPSNPGKPTAEKGARAIVATQINELVDRWGKVNPRGTVKLPAARLKASGTVYLPARVALTGPRDELVVQDMWGLYAQPGFEKGTDWSDNFVLATRRAPNNKRNANANFDARLERVMIQCLPGHAPSGVLWGGAQTTTIRDVCIWDAEAFGLCLDYGSSRVHLDSINIRNGSSSPSRKDYGESRERRGVGVRMPGCRGVSGVNIALHLCEVGFDLDGTHCVDIGNVMAEKVETVLRARGSSVISLRGIDIQRCGSVPFDLRKHQGQISITGRIRHTPSPVFYLDKRGRKVLLIAAGTDSATGRSFRLEIE